MQTKEKKLTSSTLGIGEYVMIENPNDAKANGLGQINDFIGRSMVSVTHIKTAKSVIIMHKHVRAARVSEIEAVLM